jgi:threonylcarbamoyladenosine tRNA methylthiotransferase MtaB
MRFSIATLGCKVNQYESERLREALFSLGYKEEPFGVPCELSIVNTCTVTHRSDAEGRKLLRKVLNQGRVIVTGCQAVTDPDSIRALCREVEIVAPRRFGDVLDCVLPRIIKGFSGHARAFVKIQEGCNHFCTFCIVPYARGIPLSRPAQEIIDEINELYHAGYLEVVLTGTNIGLYAGGISTIMKKILHATPIPRIRISSIEPWTIDDEFIEVIQSERICRHLHLPLQSGSQRILEAMGRPYTVDYYTSLVEEIRSRYPDMAIGADILVGFPGEDEKAFQESLTFLKDLDLAYLHVFPYSRRLGTKAADFPFQMDAAVKRSRVEVFRSLSDAKRAAFIAAQLGSIQDVLVTRVEDTSFTGLTSHYVKVHAPGRPSPGRIVRVRLEALSGLGAKGTLHG